VTGLRRERGEDSPSSLLREIHAPELGEKSRCIREKEVWSGGALSLGEEKKGEGGERSSGQGVLTYGWEKARGGRESSGPLLARGEEGRKRGGMRALVADWRGGIVPLGKKKLRTDRRGGKRPYRPSGKGGDWGEGRGSLLLYHLKKGLRRLGIALQWKRKGDPIGCRGKKERRGFYMATAGGLTTATWRGKKRGSWLREENCRRLLLTDEVRKRKRKGV